jgi:hypothetical protein
MADFLVWGRIQNLGPGEFLAIASAVPALPFSNEDTEVLTALAPLLADAQAELVCLTNAVGEFVRSKGHRLVDVEAG